MNLQHGVWEDIQAFANQHGQALSSPMERAKAIALYDEAIVGFSRQGFRVGQAYLNAVRFFEAAGNLQFRFHGKFRLEGWNTDSTFAVQLVDQDGHIVSGLLETGQKLAGEPLAPVGYGSLNLQNHLDLNPALVPFAYGLEVFDAFMDSHSAIYSLHSHAGEHVLRRWGWDALDSLERFVQGNMLWVNAPEHHTHLG